LSLAVPENIFPVNPRKTCQIGPYTLALPAVQAGLAGYSDMAMRVVARRRGCPFAVTEALLDRNILRGGHGKEKGAMLCPEDHPVAGQLMGQDPAELAEAAQILVGCGFDVIDLNFACPVKKVLGRCRGGYLLSDPEMAITMLRTVRAAISVPLTVKLRRALDDTAEARDNFYRIMDECVRLGLAAVAVHGRTVEQKYTGRANWDFLRDLVRAYPQMTILGSGDLFTAEDAYNMWRYSHVAGVWLARGAIGNPWIFTDFAALLAGRPLPTPPMIHEQRAALLEHLELAVRIYGDYVAAKQMRKIGIKFAKLHPQGHDLWREFIACHNYAQWQAVMDKYYTADGPGVRPPSVPDAEDVCK